MRRITFAFVVTVAILVLLFSYRTSLSGPIASSAVVSKAHVLTSAAASAATTSGPPVPDTSSANQVTVPSTSAASAPTTTAAKPTTTARSTTAAKPTTSAAAPSTSASKTSAAAPVVVDGDSEMTRYGAVQVEVTISGGKITDVQAIQYPNQDPRDQEINSQAIPQLHDQVIAAQSAQIDGVSGATYTSQGYTASLQSALDAANFK